MTTIYKYEIDTQKINEAQEFLLPLGTHILSCGMRSSSTMGITMNNGLFFWALVNTEETQKESRVLRVYMTGEEINRPHKNMRFINTVFVNGGEYMLHVFEIVTNKERSNGLG